MNLYDQSLFGNALGQGLGGFYGGLNSQAARMSQQEYQQRQLNQALGARNRAMEEILGARQRAQAAEGDVLEGEFEVVRDETAQLEQREA